MTRTILILATALALPLLTGCVVEVDDEDSDAAAVEVETPSLQPQYGSTYASNCYCLLCTKYCTVNDETFKSGVCCN